MLTDFETAPIGDGLREALRFLRTMTAPETLGPAAAARVLAAGVSPEALRDAVDVAAGFNLITRFADTIGARAHSVQGLTHEQAIAVGGRLFERGYA